MLISGFSPLVLIVERACGVVDVDVGVGVDDLGGLCAEDASRIPARQSLTARTPAEQ